MREATLNIRHHGSPESDVSAVHPRVSLRSVSSMTGTAARRKRIIEFRGPADSIRAYLEDFRTAPSVIEAEPLSPLETTPVLVVFIYDANRWDGLVDHFRAIGVHHRTGTVITAGWERWTLYLESDDDLRAITDRLESDGNDVELLRDVALGEIRPTYQLQLSQMTDELTTRQQQVLATAIDTGYYEAGSDTSVQAIADTVGIASSTAWEHLVSAEERVMAEVRAVMTG